MENSTDSGGAFVWGPREISIQRAFGDWEMKRRINTAHCGRSQLCVYREQKITHSASVGVLSLRAYTEHPPLSASPTGILTTADLSGW